MRPPLRYLIAYCAYSEERQRNYQALIRRHQLRGSDVEGFCVSPATLNDRQWLPFDDLARRWKGNDRALLSMYEALEEKLRLRDVFIVFNGANVHPEFLRNLSTYNVYMCWDDPDSSDLLSRPVASHFDYCFTGNASCIPLYQSWGVRNVTFLPILFFTEADYSLALTESDVLEGNRDVDIVFLGEMNVQRRDRLQHLKKNFPEAFTRGRGWPAGYFPEGEKIALYGRSKIGWNVHNSVGPCNIRTFALPANGILQICDNKCRIGEVFELGIEVVGFDRLEECVELTRYYLEHDDERRRIAASGWRRSMTDYNETANWQRMIDVIEPHVRARRDKQRTEHSASSLSQNARHGRSPHDQSKTSSAEKMVPAKRWIRKIVNRCGYDVVRVPKDSGASEFSQTDRKVAYLENPEVGHINWEEKEKRTSNGGFFEWPNMVALNYAIASLVGPWKEIIEIGGGTGVFAYEVSADPTRRIVCCERDEEALNYARRHRWRTNITYTSEDAASLTERFELAVAVDVIEHVKDFRKFVDMCACLAPNAILTTPNKNREGNGSKMSGPPEYYQHVREWTAGELYWILRAFYRDVDLYSMPNPYVPSVIPVDVVSKLTPLIAVCKGAMSAYRAQHEQ
jgi:spore maturation protein CgeB